MPLLPCIGGVFGNIAIELAGRVVQPAYQNQGIGTKLLQNYLLSVEDRPDIVTTYTRNPSVIKMLGRVCGGVVKVYPVSTDKTLAEIASRMDSATMIDNTLYHVNRYEPEGLFGGADPADRSLSPDGPPLKQQFKGLQSIRNALVIVGRPEGESRQ